MFFAVVRESETGHERRFHDIRDWSVHPLIPDIPLQHKTVEKGHPQTRPAILDFMGYAGKLCILLGTSV
jgi:hypothetical protein